MSSFFVSRCYFKIEKTMAKGIILINVQHIHGHGVLTDIRPMPPKAISPFYRIHVHRNLFGIRAFGGVYQSFFLSIYRQ